MIIQLRNILLVLPAKFDIFQYIPNYYSDIVGIEFTNVRIKHFPESPTFKIQSYRFLDFLPSFIHHQTSVSSVPSLYFRYPMVCWQYMVLLPLQTDIISESLTSLLIIILRSKIFISILFATFKAYHKKVNISFCANS